jgi:2-oxoglutarate ferredoxin oxidoreductase subunit alpha
MSPRLPKVGGNLVQAEDELASINMAIGASYGGTPSMTATSGPGLALMTESIGLSIASETPVVVVDVMRGGPSTGIPTKSEQGDLNLAVYGLHGDAPHVVVAPNSIADCVFTTQWAVHLAESMQTAAIVLSDQALGQTIAVVDKPADIAFATRRLVADTVAETYHRYALTGTGVSPMALPGTPGGQYTADGLEHNPRGTPSSTAEDHAAQMEKRLQKIVEFDYGNAWADIDGDGEVAVVAWGSMTGPVRAAARRVDPDGSRVRVVSMRLLAPAKPDLLAEALAGTSRTLVVEQTHSAQFYHYLVSHFGLAAGLTESFHRPGPLPLRPAELEAKIRELTEQ